MFCTVYGEACVAQSARASSAKCRAATEVKNKHFDLEQAAAEFSRVKNNQPVDS